MKGAEGALKAPGRVDETEEELEASLGVEEVAQGASRAAEWREDGGAREGVGRADEEVVRNGLGGFAAGGAGGRGSSSDACEVGVEGDMPRSELYEEVSLFARE